MKTSRKVTPMGKFALCCIIFLTIWVFVGKLISQLLFPAVPVFQLVCILVIGGWISNFGILMSRIITKKILGE